MMTDDEIKTIMSLYDLENALGDLYEIFSKKFPEHNNLWQTLIAQEREHAEALRNFYRLYYEGKTVFNLERIRLDAVKSIIEHVGEIGERAQKGNYNAYQAIATTYDLESSLIARNTFRHIGVSKAFADVLKRLQEDSENHANMAKKELESLRAAQ